METHKTKTKILSNYLARNRQKINWRTRKTWLLSHLIGARWIALFEHAVFIVHVGMGSDFAKGHFISTQIYGHNPNYNNYNLQGICFVWLEGIKSLLGRGYYFSGFVTVFHTQKHAKMVYCLKNCEKWYFVTKIVLTYCEKKLF